MTKQLTLHCQAEDCDHERPFYGRGVEQILDRIDQSGWIDLPGGDMPKGHSPGYCPEHAFEPEELLPEEDNPIHDGADSFDGDAAAWGPEEDRDPDNPSDFL